MSENFMAPIRPLLATDQKIYKGEVARGKRSSLKPGSPGDEDAKLKKTTAELESVFIYQLLKVMRATIPKSELMGGESAQGMYDHMVDTQMAQQLSSDRGIGLSDLLLRQLDLAGNGSQKVAPKSRAE